MSALHNKMRDQSNIEMSRINEVKEDVNRTRPVTDLDRSRSNLYSKRPSDNNNCVQETRPDLFSKRVSDKIDCIQENRPTTALHVGGSHLQTADFE